MISQGKLNVCVNTRPLFLGCGCGLGTKITNSTEHTAKLNYEYRKLSVWVEVIHHAQTNSTARVAMKVPSLPEVNQGSEETLVKGYEK